ncbi:MAG TPA: KpsF/GutQ family sugar-phosphate isomerase, partial [Pirellulales bacterium]|nr:KpsF/GutQ family sugar-phosphate isomerase [Pirellulales bacterium]
RAMSTAAAPAPGPLSPFEQLRYAKQIIQMEAQALEGLAGRLDTEFCRAVEELYHCPGSVIVTGIGKAGLIGQKIAATLSSTGTRSHFLHAGEAVHGDLGRIHRTDALLVLSQSGETQEVIRLLPTLKGLGIPNIAITGSRASTLGRAAHVTIQLGSLKEACALGLAPSTSTTAMLAMGDALALVTSRMRSFGREDFARFHPGGSLGRQLAKVEDCMRPLADCRVAICSESVRQVFVERRFSGRRTGAIMIVDPDEILRGIFTDSDLARLFESRRDGALDGPIRDVMTKRPTTVPLGSMLTDAVEIMGERKISELPVVDMAGRPVGLIDVTDVVSLFPEGNLALQAAPAAKSSAVPPPKNPAFTNRPPHPRQSAPRGDNS